MTTSENAGASVGGSPVGRPFASPSDSGDRRTGAASGRKGDMEHLGVPGGVGGSGRLGRRQLVALSDQLSARDRAILGTVERFRLVRGDQLQRLHFNTITTSTGAARVARRSLQRLVESGLLARTERRVGGTGSGSTAHSYVLTAAGRRMVALARGDGAVSDRGLHEPGLRFHQHTLAITELHVRLVEAAWVGPLEVVAFVPEPGSWRQTAPGGVLKPDAFVIVATGEFEQLWMVEVDLATESRQTIRRKLDAYVAHHATGVEQHAHGVFPLVAWLTVSPGRQKVIDSVIATLAFSARRLFTTGLLDDPLATLADGGTL